jgi:predicted RND superfamily exporter protein
MAIKKKANNTAKGWKIGGALTAAAIATAAGAYLLSDKKTKTKAKAWATQARKEVVKNMKTAKKLGEKEYGFIVEEAIKHHASMEKLTAADVVAAAKELKSEWKKIEGEAKRVAKKVPMKKVAAKKKPAVRKAKPAKRVAR